MRARAHPYFPCGPDTRIDTQVEHVWTIDDMCFRWRRFPRKAATISMIASLRPGSRSWLRRLERRGSDQRPKLALSGSASSPEASFFQLYSPSGGGIFVAEPVTHANAALNAPEVRWPALGMRVLEPGGEMRIDIRLGRDSEIAVVQVDAWKSALYRPPLLGLLPETWVSG